jgi:hypothetical protein
VCHKIKKGKDTTGHHFGPDLPHDLKEADGAKVTHHGRAVGLLLDEDQQNSLPWSGVVDAVQNSCRCLQISS